MGTTSIDPKRLCGMYNTQCPRRGTRSRPRPHSRRLGPLG